MKLSTLFRLGPAALCVAACGDPLLTRQDRGDPVFDLHGEVISGTDDPPASDYRVAVLLLHDAVEGNPKPPFTPRWYLETEVIPGTLTGQVPAQFRVAVTDIPSVLSDVVYPIRADVAGDIVDGVFDDLHAPDGVRIGFVAIGPAEELAALPRQVNHAQNALTLDVLAPYLPNTTITGYQVVYAEGVGPDDVLYPKHDENLNTMGGVPLSEGFTLIDARAYYDALIWQSCAIVHFHNGDLVPYRACLDDNADLISCLDSCPATDAEVCESVCRAASPDQLDRAGCLGMFPDSDVITTCGPYQAPRADRVRIMSPHDPLSVTLGEGDIKAGLWSQWVDRNPGATTPASSTD